MVVQLSRFNNINRNSNYTGFNAAFSPLANMNGRNQCCANRRGCGCGCGCKCGCRCGCRCGCSCVPCIPNQCIPCPALFLVSFDTNGGAPVPLTQIIPNGCMAVRPMDPVMEGYIFLGWYPTADFSGEPWDFENNPVTENMVLYARWMLEVFTVEFEANGGLPVPEPQAVPYGGLIAEPANPVRDGYVFAGWYLTPDFIGNPWDFDNYAVDSDLTLYARWILLAD